MLGSIQSMDRKLGRKFGFWVAFTSAQSTLAITSSTSELFHLGNFNPRPLIMKIIQANWLRVNSYAQAAKRDALCRDIRN